MRSFSLFFTALVLTSLTYAGVAEAQTKFKTRFSSIERVKADYTYTQKSGELVATIDISDQKMYVERTGRRKLSWTISSGAQGHETPSGSYRPTRIYSRYFSKTYDDAPMHNAVFFHGGYAIHQTGSFLAMGSPASHGCIRLFPHNAAQFLKMVQAYGPKRTKIVVRN